MGEELLERLLERRSYFVSFARKINRNDGEDAVQQAFLQVSRKAADLEDRNVESYMKQAIRNVLINWYRVKQRRGVEVPLDFDIAVIEERSIDIDLTEAVRRAVDWLPEHYRFTFLDFCDGLSYKEIAEKYDVALGTVMSRMARARELVRERLKNYS